MAGKGRVTMSSLAIHEPSLVVLCGPSGSGKSSFARRHFPKTAIVSSDLCRAMVADDERDMGVSAQAFTLFHTWIEQRLLLGRLTVADSTALTPDARRRLLQLAKRYDVPAVLVLFNVDEPTCVARDARREAPVGAQVIESQHRLLAKAIQLVPKERFHHLRILTGTEVEAAEVRILPLPVFSDEVGPFDVIGDIHGCGDELEELLQSLGYVHGGGEHGVYSHPEGRKVIFLGDLSDRGPRSLDSAILAMNMVENGHALFVPGNHDRKLVRFLKGAKVMVAHGMETTAAELSALTDADRARFSRRFTSFYDGAPPYLVIDEGRLVAAHAGIEESMIGRLSRRIVDFTLFGDPTGEYTPEGRPIRRDWAMEYRGSALVTYGHTPVPQPEFINNTANLDQGCCFGGWLTALRYPERQFVQVRARKPYYTASIPDWLVVSNQPTLGGCSLLPVKNSCNRES